MLLACNGCFGPNTMLMGRFRNTRLDCLQKDMLNNKGVDFHETFSLVAHFKTVRIFLAFASQFKWHVLQFDVEGRIEQRGICSAT